MKNNFKRSNVDLNSIQVSAPDRSSFDLSINRMATIPFGQLFPVRVSKMTPGDTFKGSVNPSLQLENFATQAAGRMRLDTNSFFVSCRRIHSQYRQFTESALGSSLSFDNKLPNFTLTAAFKDVISYYFTNYADASTPCKTFKAFWTKYSSSITTTSLSKAFKSCLPIMSANLRSWANNNTCHKGDWFLIEADRIDAYATEVASDDVTVGFGDFIESVCRTLLGEGSILDMLGYDIISYYGIYRSNLNKAAADFETAYTPGTGEPSAVQVFFTSIDGGTGNSKNVLYLTGYNTSVTPAAFTFDINLTPSMSEMMLRANYAVWYDYYRNWHLEPRTSVLDPDSFGSLAIIGEVALTSVMPQCRPIQLLAPRSLNWSRDMFTMVQPDDVYRHVYAPASSSFGVSKVIHTPGDVDRGDNTFSSQFVDIESIFYNTENTSFLPFPSNMFSQFGVVDSSFETFYHDLQTMRRANMLERYLTKNYFNPDTYVGYVEAHYGVKPVDFSILTVQALGGNEQMIQGDQVVSSITTDDKTTVAGQRTLKADAGVSDEFSYNTSEMGYLLSYVTITPLIHYDARNPHLHELTPQDQLLPEYANDNRIVIRTCDLLRNFNDKQEQMLGYVPRYYGYRTALDDVHGRYLRDYRAYTWLRDRYIYTQGYLSSDAMSGAMLSKDALSEHINIPLDCFLGLKPWDHIAFGAIDLKLFVERALPAKIEFI